MLVNNDLTTKNGQKNYANFKNAEKAIGKKATGFLVMGFKEQCGTEYRKELMDAGQVRYLIVEKEGRYFPVVIASGVSLQYWLGSGFMILG